MSVETNFTVAGGLPFSKRVRIENGRAIWSELDGFEARMQIRVEPDFKSRLKYDFTSHLNKSFEGEDIVISWDLTGAQTRLMKGGHYDLIVSDPGQYDIRALRLIHGKITVDPIVSAPLEV